MSSSVIKTALAHLTVLLGTGGARAIAFLSTILLAKVLGAEGFGQYSLFSATMFISWQVPQAFDTTFIRYAKVNEHSDNVQECLRAATRLKCLYSILIIILAGLTAAGLSWWEGPSDRTGMLVASGMLCGVALSFIGSVSNLLRIKEHFGHYTLIQGVYNLTIFLALCFCVYVIKNISADIAIYLYIVIALLYGCLSLYIVVKVSGNPFSASKESNKLMFDFGKWIFLMTLAYFFSSRIDVLILPYFVEYKEVGIYSAATQITLIIAVMISSMSAIFLPRSMRAAETKDALVKYIKECLIPIGAVLSGIIALYITAPYVFKYLFSHEFIEAAQVLRVLLIGCAFVTIYAPFSFLFYAIDKPHIRCGLEVIKLFTLGGILLLFIPKYGIMGAAYAVSCGMAINCFMSLAILRRYVKKTPALQHEQVNKLTQ